MSSETGIEAGVIRHYTAYDVLERIRAGIEALGYDPDNVPPEVLKPVDEFHTGGAEATLALLDELSLHADMNVLDIGCGIGGPARVVAGRSGARVTGIDLTPGFVEAARKLSDMCGMRDRVSFQVASATSLPFDDATFDLATLLHVGMNIPDKGELFSEAARVLRDGGVFAVYDMMITGAGSLAYPVPWAETEDLSAIEAPEVYREAAARAGLKLSREEDRRGAALDFFARIQKLVQSAAPSPLGLHLLLGPTVQQKTANLIGAIRAGTIAPVQMIFEKSRGGD